MELTIAVHREDRGYWAQVTKSEDPYLEGVASDAWTLTELQQELEDALGMVLGDEAVTLTPETFVEGFNQASLTRSPTAGSADLPSEPGARQRQ